MERKPRRMKLRTGAAKIAKEKRENRKLSAAQKERFIKALERYEGESEKRFENRVKKMKQSNRIITKTDSLREKRTRLKKKVRYAQTQDRLYYELKYYAIVLWHYSVKFGIPTDIFKLLIFYYDNREFSREEFMRIYQMTEVKPKYTFKYFLDNGYIKEVTYTQNFLRKKSKIVKTDRFRLSTQMIFRITGFYEMYMMMLDLDEGFLTIELIPDRMVKFINDLERESNQIIAGKLSPDKIEMFKKMID